MASWKAEIIVVNGVKQIRWEFGTQKGVALVNIEEDPSDVVEFLKETFGEDWKKEMEEEGKKEIQLPKMPVEE